MKIQDIAEQPGNKALRYRRRIFRSTVLRDLHRLSVPESPDVRRIRVDDWAFRKGFDDFSKWLETHRDIRLVSRDRFTEYSHTTISASGLEATEVADRFYLIKNMGGIYNQ